jgi:hypothetical protein
MKSIKGHVDGMISSETERAFRWFQSVDKIPVTGRIETLRALQISVSAKNLAESDKLSAFFRTVRAQA